MLETCAVPTKGVLSSLYFKLVSDAKCFTFCKRVVVLVTFLLLWERDQSDTLFPLGTLLGTLCCSSWQEGFVLDLLASIFEHINYFLKKSQVLDYDLLRKLDSKQHYWKTFLPRTAFYFGPFPYVFLVIVIINNVYFTWRTILLVTSEHCA